MNETSQITLGFCTWDVHMKYIPFTANTAYEPKGKRMKRKCT